MHAYTSLVFALAALSSVSLAFPVGHGAKMDPSERDAEDMFQLRQNLVSVPASDPVILPKTDKPKPVGAAELDVDQGMLGDLEEISNEEERPGPKPCRTCSAVGSGTIARGTNVKTPPGANPGKGKNGVLELKLQGRAPGDAKAGSAVNNHKNKFPNNNNGVSASGSLIEAKE